VSTAEPIAPSAQATVHVAWAGGHRFDAGRPHGATLRLDGSGESGQSPVDAVLSALASCASADVVDILAKRRTPVTSLTVDVVGQRTAAMPRRLTQITLTFTVAGEGLERAQVERAIDLSITKYCSVRDSLRDDISVDWVLVLHS